jgi:hypothetical protein
MTLRVSVGELTKFQFLVVNVDGETPYSGLTNGDFTKIVLNNGAVSSIVATISEIGSTGHYVCSFTPNTGGLWGVSIHVIPTGDWLYDEAQAEAFGLEGQAEAQMNVAYDSGLSTMYLEVWLDRDGQSVISGLVSCEVKMYDRAGTLLFMLTSSSPLANGRFSLSSIVGLTVDRPYNANVKVTDALGSVTTFQALTVIE